MAWGSGLGFRAGSAFAALQLQALLAHHKHVATCKSTEIAETSHQISPADPVMPKPRSETRANNYILQDPYFWHSGSCMKSRVKATGRLQKSFDHLYFESRESHLGLSGNRATKSFWWDVTWLFSISDGSGRSSPGFRDHSRYP